MAREYCHLIETRRRRTIRALLARAHRLLPRLYAFALELRPLNDRTEAPDIRLPGNRWKEIYDDLRGSLGALGRYSEVYDPYQLNEVPVETSLADDFADIYLDLKPGRKLWELGFREAAVNSWLSLFRFHWSEHATGAIRALGWLELQHDFNPPHLSSREPTPPQSTRSRRSVRE